MKRIFQKKLLLVVLAVLIVLNGVVVSGSHLIILDRFLQLEQQGVEKNLLRVANAVQDAAEVHLGVLCRDWSVWDDTYAYIQDHNQAYVKSNLVDDTLIDLSLNAILYFNDQGELVFGKAMDLDEEVLAPLPAELLDYLTQHDRLWPPRQTLALDGLVRFSQGPMLLSIRPILTSEGEGPARGLLVMARWFDHDVVADLATRTALTLSSQPFDDVWPEIQRDIYLQVTSRDEQNVRGEIFINDLDGNPGVRLAITMNRDVYQQGRDTVTLFQIGFFAVSLIFGVVLYILIVLGRQRRFLAERQFSQAFEHATDGLLVINDSRRLTLINPAAQQMLGCPKCDLFQGEQACLSQSALTALIDAGLKGDTVGPTEFTAAVPFQGTLQELRAYVAPLKPDGENPHGVIVTLQDMTQVKALEHLKDEFIAAVAHEMNTPLSIVSGYADLLVNREYESEGEFREFVGLIQEKAQTLEKIVNDLLQLNKANADRKVFLEKETYDPCENIRQIVDSFRVETQRHQFVVSLPQAPVAITADRHRVGQVLDNLLSNAVKYSPDGGVVTVSLERDDADLKFCVTDQGGGMAAVQVARAFEKFYRADNSETAVRGMGLGLNIAKEIVEAHGGRIWLESTPGSGTRACFTLPCIDPPR